MTQAGIILAIAVLGYWVLRLILEGIGTLLGGGVSAVDGIAKSKMTKNAERRFNQETIKWTKEKNEHEQIQHEQIKQQKAEAKRKYDLELKNWVDKKYTIQLEVEKRNNEALSEWEIADKKIMKHISQKSQILINLRPITKASNWKP